MITKWPYEQKQSKAKQSKVLNIANIAEQKQKPHKDTLTPSGIRLRLEKSASGVWSSSPSVSRRNSSSQPDPVPECSNCSKPFFLNHQCDNNYDVDEDDYFDIEKEIDEIDDKYKKILLRRAEQKCDCSVHSTLNNGHSPKAKKPRNQKYPKDCNLIKLRKGEIELMDFCELSKSCRTQ